jgi:hypothetical protein
MKQHKQYWTVKCSRFDCAFMARGRIYDSEQALNLARAHADETRHHCELKAQRIELCRVHGDCLKVEKCPNCYVPYPLMLQAEPQSVARYVKLAVSLVEHREAPCATYPDQTDVVYACGCISHTDHMVGPRYGSLTLCKAHTPIRENTHTQGCCYSCDKPLTRAARAYQKAVNRDLDLQFPCEAVQLGAGE